MKVWRSLPSRMVRLRMFSHENPGQSARSSTFVGDDPFPNFTFQQNTQNDQISSADQKETQKAKVVNLKTAQNISKVIKSNNDQAHTLKGKVKQVYETVLDKAADVLVDRKHAQTIEEDRKHFLEEKTHRKILSDVFEQTNHKRLAEEYKTNPAVEQKQIEKVQLNIDSKQRRHYTLDKEHLGLAMIRAKDNLCEPNCPADNVRLAKKAYEAANGSDGHNTDSPFEYIQSATQNESQ